MFYRNYATSSFSFLCLLYTLTKIYTPFFIFNPIHFYVPFLVIINKNNNKSLFAKQHNINIIILLNLFGLIFLNNTPTCCKTCHCSIRVTDVSPLDFWSPDFLRRKVRTPFNTCTIQGVYLLCMQDYWHCPQFCDTLSSLKPQKFQAKWY